MVPFSVLRLCNSFVFIILIFQLLAVVLVVVSGSEDVTTTTTTTTTTTSNKNSINDSTTQQRFVAAQDIILQEKEKEEGKKEAMNESSSSSSSSFTLRIIDMPGVVLYKTDGPIDDKPVGNDFPGQFPVQFIQTAWNINVLETIGGQQIMATHRHRLSLDLQEKEKEQEQESDNNQYNDTASLCVNNNSNATSIATTNNDDGDNDNELSYFFGQSILARAREMFMERQLEYELDSFLSSGVSNPNAGPRRMHWVGIEIKPNMSLALHSHPNVEFAYIVQGVMHEWRLTDPTIEKKKSYIPEKVVQQRRISNDNNNDNDNDDDIIMETKWKYIGPNLTNVDAGKTFEHRFYREGDMFINTIGDVHQSFTKEEGVKLFVMWGDGNADVPETQLPQNSSFLNKQSAQAWT